MTEDPTPTRAPKTSRFGGANVRVPPPATFLGVGVASLLLHRFAPLQLGLPTGVVRGVAVVVIGGAVLLLAGAFHLFQRTGQDPQPWKPSPEIITSGVFRFTRNPMYLAMALLLFGFGLLRGNFWLLFAAPVFLVLVYLTAVRHEEAYLEHRFGDSYRDYRLRVRRWL